ncbi:unnamed protein product [Anisakis simplex]|uniref:G-protein coupled receptors family 1 profile domain-containing protein n=1 Tax=Anisakis simplex TaxID=6269 RepID=A0A3P6QHS1_ANISI|nr:unnamed protein product [Anisakis simplex]
MVLSTMLIQAIQSTESFFSYPQADNIAESTTLSSHFCESAFFHPYTCTYIKVSSVFSHRSIHVIEALLSLLSLILNTCTTVITQNAIPIAIAQRRVMVFIHLFAFMATNYALLAGFQLARNVFLLFSLRNPCMTSVTTVNCKLEQFPLLFCYIHCGALVLALSVQTTHPLRVNEASDCTCLSLLYVYSEERRLLSWFSSCSIWQSALVILCLAVTLLFTAFDNDSPSGILAQCSAIMAIRERQLGFWLISILISMHGIALVIVYLATYFQFRIGSTRLLLTYSFKIVVSIETFLWEMALFLTGVLAVYQYVANYVCKECLLACLEMSFVLMPLLISFLHPLLIVWNVLPLRDAAVRVFPSLTAIVPEYSFVSPPSTGLLQPSTFRMQSSPYTDRESLKKPLILGEGELSPKKHLHSTQPSTSSNKCDA